MLQLWHEIDDFVRTMATELCDLLEIANRWLERIIAILIFLPVLILWMEFCLPRDLNYTAVPFVALSLLMISIWLIVTKLRPLGVALVLVGPRAPGVRGTWIADAWRKMRNWFIGIYVIEFVFVLIAWPAFYNFPINELHLAMILFFSVILLWLLSYIVGKPPRSLTATISIIIVLVLLLVISTLGYRPLTPSGFRAASPRGIVPHDFQASKAPSVIVDYHDGGYGDEVLPPHWGKYTVVERSSGGWVSISCPGNPRGPIRYAGDPLGDEETGRSDFADCPNNFLIQGTPGGWIKIGPPLKTAGLR